MVTHDQESDDDGYPYRHYVRRPTAPSRYALATCTITLTVALPLNLSAKPIFLTASLLTTAPISLSSNVTAENHVRIDHGLGVPNEHEIWISIRPEDIDLHKEKPEHLGAHSWAQGTVKEIAYLGSFAIYHIKLANGRVVKTKFPHLIGMCATLRRRLGTRPSISAGLKTNRHLCTVNLREMQWT